MSRKVQKWSAPGLWLWSHSVWVSHKDGSLTQHPELPLLSLASLLVAGPWLANMQWQLWQGGHLSLHPSSSLIFPSSGTHQPRSLPLHSEVIFVGSLQSPCPWVGIQLLILSCLLPKQLILLLRSCHSIDGEREQWLKDELIGWRSLPLRQHRPLHLPPAPSYCQHWCLSAGGQTSEQTLPIREVTPLVWQTQAYCAWDHSREPYGLHKKRFAKGETRGAPEGNLCQMGGPFWCSSQVKLVDGPPFDVHLIQAIVAPLPIPLSFRGRLQRIHLGSLKPLLFFCSSLFPQVSYGELLSFAPLCGENRAGKYQ